MMPSHSLAWSGVMHGVQPLKDLHFNGTLRLVHCRRDPVNYSLRHVHAYARGYSFPRRFDSAISAVHAIAAASGCLLRFPADQ